MAPQTRSKTKAIKANTAPSRMGKAKPPSFEQSADSSTSTSASSLSSSFHLLLNNLSFRRMARSVEGSESESSFDDEELDLVYKNCKDIIDHADHCQTDSQAPHQRNEKDIDEEGEGFDEEGLDFVYQKCQAMMDHLDLNQSHSEDQGNAGNNDPSGFDSDFAEGHPDPTPPASSSSSHPEHSQHNDGPSVHHITSMLFHVSFFYGPFDLIYL